MMMLVMTACAPPVMPPWLAGSLAVSVGGTSVCIWDVMAGGRLLRRLTNFQKTVTCVCMSPLAGPEVAAAPRLLAGSLDGHVKVC
jgi:U3 small nucleolar RNA-associated protein 15